VRIPGTGTSCGSARDEPVRIGLRRERTLTDSAPRTTISS
jgi:hypothetical protein